jgi:hypothetical protein
MEELYWQTLLAAGVRRAGGRALPAQPHRAVDSDRRRRLVLAALSALLR